MDSSTKKGISSAVIVSPTTTAINQTHQQCDFLGIADGTSNAEKLHHSSLQDQASLLLSIAGIAQTELKASPLALQDSPFPSFPVLTNSNQQQHLLVPRVEPFRNYLATSGPSYRLRSVSIDSSTFENNNTTINNKLSAPLPSPPSLLPKLVSPPVAVTAKKTKTSTTRTRFRSARLSIQTRRRRAQQTNNANSSSSGDDDEEYQDTPRSKAANNSNKPKLQGCPPSGVEITKIMRRKFSWKNYPELEQFLVANREEYLRHSALNYTLQQKQYNNRLTNRLLELATHYGYLFDCTDFTFVTVRDRIRCYYKSFVQSAKKRGVLMGYAARKAGLLTPKELEESASRQGTIVE